MTSLSEKQGKALDAVKTWYNNGYPDTPLFRLFGYAGTGKSTIAKEFQALVGGTVLYATFTGKAASVLNRKGTPASTIHRLIYRLRPPSKTRVEEMLRKIQDAPQQDVAKLKEELVQLQKPVFDLISRDDDEAPINSASLIVIDECSMVDERMGKDLLSFGVPILVLGDPGQLPPVKGAGFFTNAKPDFMLDEIHRQAAGSPIIQLATFARNGTKIPPGTYGNCQVLSRGLVRTPDVLAADQLIVGRNATRATWNKQIRLHKGFPLGLPIVGDKVICLRNDKETGILNGTQWEVLATTQDRWVKLSLQSLDDETTVDVSCHPQPFLGDQKGMDEMPFYIRNLAQEFDYGYCITCHKAQGSQWPHVAVMNESYCFRDDAHKWLYTAITRAEQKLTLML